MQHIDMYYITSGSNAMLGARFYPSTHDEGALGDRVLGGGGIDPECQDVLEASRPHQYRATVSLLSMSSFRIGLLLSLRRSKEHRTNPSLWRRG